MIFEAVPRVYGSYYMMHKDTKKMFIHCVVSTFFFATINKLQYTHKQNSMKLLKRMK